MTTQADLIRIQENLAFIRDNPLAQYPAGWIDEVKGEARKAGLLPMEQSVVGQSCPSATYPVVYGGDMVDVF